MRELHYVGLLRSMASWAKVARELLDAVQRQGVRVTAQEFNDDRALADFPLSPSLESALRVPSVVGVPTLTFTAPMNYRRLPPRSGPLVGILVYEATRWPHVWIAEARQRLARAVVPCPSARESLVSSGFPRDRVGIVPHGFAPDVYHNRGRRRANWSDPLRLLFVGTPAHRKGLDLLVEAVQQAFRPTAGRTAQPVQLRVKTVRYTDEGRRPYLDQQWRARLERLCADGVDVDLIEDALSERQMAALYRGADLLCLPFRGECSPLPPLEAMACGTPVLSTAWAGVQDLADAGVALLVEPARAIPAAPLLADNEADPAAMMVEPAVADLSRCLLWAQENRSALAELGRAAARHVQHFTWDAAARTLIREIDLCATHGSSSRRSATRRSSSTIHKT